MDDSPSSMLSVQTVIRKSPCRYGRGCTHINDPSHLERFRHPLKQELNAEDIRRNYMCNECGLGYDSLAELRFHLQKKTAWSNESLVGCRISCLVDSKEWHEGLITHYHRFGKHCVEFRAVSEKRWFHMLKLAFYIIEPLVDHEKNEFKDNGSGLADNDMNIQKEWVYYEDISFDYAFTQSVLFKIYGGIVQETGHKTRGHVSLTEYDRYNARSQKGSLLYGELLPRGVNKALDPHHLDAAKARVLFDMGMGTGKVAIQAFLQFRNLVYVYGVELSVGRYLVAEAAALHMVQLLGQESFHVDVIHGEQITITELVADNTEKGRALRLQCGNMMDVRDVSVADIIMMETDVPAHLQVDLCTMIQQEMHDNARILSYHDLFKIWPLPVYPFKQLDINCSLADRFPTSWSVQRGHHFFLFKKNNRQNSKNSFQRHLQRTIGMTTGINEGACASKSPSWSSTNHHQQQQQQPAFNSATPPKHTQFTAGEVSPPRRHDHNLHLAEKECRESEAYATAFPLLSTAGTHQDATGSHHNKEIPQLKNRNDYGNTVDVVDESGCACSVLPAFLSCFFSSSRPKQEKDNHINIGSVRRKSRSTPPQQSYNTANPSPSPSPSSSNQQDRGPTMQGMTAQKSFSSPRRLHAPSPRPDSPPRNSPAAQIKIITSNSPRSVLVEQNKSPRKEAVSSPVT